MKRPLVVSEAERRTLGWWCPASIVVDGATKPCATFTGEMQGLQEHCRVCGAARGSSRRFLLERDTEDRDLSIARAARGAIAVLQRIASAASGAGEAMQNLDRSLDRIDVSAPGKSVTFEYGVDVDLARLAFRLLVEHEWSGSEDRDLCPDCRETRELADGPNAGNPNQHGESCAWGRVVGILRERLAVERDAHPLVTAVYTGDEGSQS